MLEPDGTVDPVPDVEVPDVDVPEDPTLSSLLERIGTLEVDVADTGELVDMPLFKGPGHIVLIAGEEVHVFVYDGADTAKDMAIRLMSDENALSEIAGSTSAKLYALDRFVVLYLGESETVVRALDGVFGGPLVGGTTIEPGETPGDVVIDEPERTALVTINNQEELERLLGLIHDEALIERLSAVDFEDDFVLAVLRGEMPTAGYSVSINDVRHETEIVEVFVSLTNPVPDESVAQVITFPLAVQVVSRSDIQEPGERAWAVISADGQVLIEVAPWVGSGSSSGSTGGTVGIDVPGQIDDPLVDPQPDVTNPPRGFDIRGSITTHETGDGTFLARLLIEAGEGREAGYDIAWVGITEKTLIQRSGQEAEETVGALEPGTQVQIVFDGAVAESYPVQAVARFVVILE